MSSIESKIAYLEETKGEIRKAIANKGVEISENDTFRCYVEKINSIKAEKPEQTKTATPTTSEQVVKADEGFALESVTIAAVDNTVDENIQPENIKEGVVILGTIGTMKGEKPDMLQQKVDQTNSCSFLCHQYGGDNIEFLNGLDTSQVTSFGSMFYNCKKLGSIYLPNFNTSNATSMYQMFAGCSGLIELNVTNFDTSKVTNMYGMFSYCEALTSLDLSNFDTSNVTDMTQMFSYCEALTSLDLSGFDTSKVKQFTNMFNCCKALENIMGKINLINSTGVSYMFNRCTILENVTLLNIKKSLQMGSGTSYGTKLSNETLINTIQQLWDLTGSTSQTLTLSTTSKNNIANIYVKLIDVTDEMLAQDQYAGNKKPCVVCESTDAGAMTLTEYATSKNWAIA